MTKEHKIREEIETGNFRIVEHEGLFAVQKEVIPVISRVFALTNWLWRYSEFLHSVNADEPEWKFYSTSEEDDGVIKEIEVHNGVKHLCIEVNDYHAKFVLVYDTLLEAQGEKIYKEKKFRDELEEGKAIEWKEVK